MSSKTVHANLSIASNELVFERTDGDGSCYKYIGVASLGLGAGFPSDKKAAYLKTGDNVTLCINQYEEVPLCSEFSRCHATFLATSTGHPQQCACGACGYTFRVTPPGTCGCQKKAIFNRDYEPCVIM